MCPTSVRSVEPDALALAVSVRTVPVEHPPEPLPAPHGVNMAVMFFEAFPVVFDSAIACGFVCGASPAMKQALPRGGFAFASALTLPLTPAMICSCVGSKSTSVCVSLA